MTVESTAALTPAKSGLPVPTLETAALSLSQPRSRCPHCKHTLAWHENIPVLSYVLLRGMCSACGQAFSLIKIKECTKK